MPEAWRNSSPVAVDQNVTAEEKKEERRDETQYFVPLPRGDNAFYPNRMARRLCYGIALSTTIPYRAADRPKVPRPKSPRVSFLRLVPSEKRGFADAAELAGVPPNQCG